MTQDAHSFNPKFENINSVSELLEFEQKRIKAHEQAAQQKVMSRDTTGHHEELRFRALVYLALPLVIESYAASKPGIELPAGLLVEADDVARVADEAFEHNDFSHMSNVFCQKDSMHGNLSILERMAKDYKDKTTS